MHQVVSGQKLSEREIGLALFLCLGSALCLLFLAILAEGIVAQKRSLYQEVLVARQWWRAYGSEVPQATQLQEWAKSQQGISPFRRLAESIFQFCRYRNDLRVVGISDDSHGVSISLEGRSAALVDLLSKWEEEFPELAVRQVELHRAGRTAGSPLRATLLVSSLVNETTDSSAQKAPPFSSLSP